MKVIPTVRIWTAFLIGVVLVVGGTAAPVQAHHVSYDPMRYEVKVPSDYEDSQTRRYPVLYLLGGNGWDEHTWFKVVDGQALADQNDVIIVTPCCGDSFFVDWRDGQHNYETRFVEELIPTIDATYRTVADRSHRAIAGESAGGYGAAILAARHPDQFVAVGSFSGAPDIMHPAAVAALMGVNTVFSAPNPPSTQHPMFGDPVTDELSWRERNPTDLVRNLRGMSVYHSIGDGVPGESDLHAFGPLFAATEIALRLQNESFHDALERARVPHEYHVRRGVHDDVYFAEQLHAWMPVMETAIGSSPPAAFDFQSADPSFEVWGWSVSADPTRAREFLELASASCNGVVLRGSGRTTVTTAPCFRPGQRVQAGDAGIIRVDNAGRITFEVDLGVAHQTQQYTPEARAAEASSSEYFRTVEVMFVPERPGVPPTCGAGWC